MGGLQNDKVLTKVVPVLEGEKEDSWISNFPIQKGFNRKF